MTNTIHRTAINGLIAWKSGANRKPLLVQGARQVGKTFLIKGFGEKEYEDYSYFNFEETPQLISLFEKDLTPEKLISTLSAYSGKVIKPGTTLLFFDEIQACPRALTSFKYFCEQAPEYHVVGAGSLLGVSVGKTTGFPVGKVHFLNLYPLSFFEFIRAAGDKQLLDVIRNNTSLYALSDLLHEKLSDLLKVYLYTGGMPEIVASYMKNKDFQQVRYLQKDIIKAYERDFSKYTTPTQAVRVSEIWRSIPAQLARENKKFKFTDAKKGGRAAQFESAVEWLRKAGLIYSSVNISAPKLPLRGYEDHGRFKIYAHDCGLLGAMLDLPSKTIVTGDALFSEYNGAFIENYAAAVLAVKNDGTLHYWISEGIAEVDFLVEYDGAILPLEVKNGLSKSVKSLRVYADKYPTPRVYRTSPRNFEAQVDFVNIPLYALEIFPEVR